MLTIVIALLTLGLIGLYVLRLRRALAEERAIATQCVTRLEEQRRTFEAARRTQLTQSRRVLKGKLSEELFPILAACPYLPADMRFIGAPIDYLILDGYSDAKDDGGAFREIIFADVKTGSARLSTHQRKIRDAVRAGRVRWETIRITDDGSVVFERDDPIKSS